MNRDLKEASILLTDTLEFLHKSFGRVLRAKRIKAGLTQRQLGIVAKVRAETVSRIESGHGNPTLSTILRLVRGAERA